MIESAWNLDFASDERRLWVDSLLPHDAEQASAAVIKLYERQRTQRPTIADLRRAIDRVRGAIELKLETRSAEPERAERPPDWVEVWATMRWSMAPRDMRSLPQQSDFVMPEMTVDEYHLMHSQWVKAGAPRMALRMVQGAFL